MAQFAVLPFKLLQALAIIRRETGALPAIAFGLLDPGRERLRDAAGVGRNGRYRCPQRRAFGRVVENHPHGAFAHFKRLLGTS